MAIGSAVQQGKFVCVYNEKGVMLFGKLGTLLGYTGSSVTVRQGNFAITYNLNSRNLDFKIFKN